MWKSQGRAYSRNLGRCLILGTRKGKKKGHQKFYLQLPFNPSALYWNKALYNFRKRVQHSIVKCNIKSIQTMGFRICPAGGTLLELPRGVIQVCRISRGESLFSLEFPVPGVFSKKSENLRNQSNTKNRWLCSSSYALFMLL